MNKFAATVVRNSSFGLIAQLLIKVLSFIFSVMVVRRLGAQSFGQYSAVIAFGVTFAFLSDLGLGTYSVREIARLRDQPPDGPARAEQLYANVLWLRLVLAAITIVLIGGFALATGRPLFLVGAIVLNAAGLLLYAVQGASEAVLYGFERLDVTSKARVFNQLTFVVLGAGALFLGWGYYGLVAAGLAGVGVMTVACWRGVRSLGLKVLPPIPGSWWNLIRASFPFGIISFALGLSYKFDTILLTIYRGDTETGYYNAAYNLVFSTVLISNVINTALYPSLTRQAAKSPENLPRIFERVLRYLMLVSLPAAVGIWALAGQIVPLLFTSAYQPAIQALRIVIWVVPLMFASEFLGYMVLIANKETLVARSVLISTGFNVLVNFFLVPRFGFVAAAYMTVLTEAVLVGQYLWALRQQIAKVNLLKSVVLPTAAAALMGLLVYLYQDQILLIVSVLLGGLIYGLLLLLFGVVGKDDFRFIRANRGSSSNVADP